MLTNRYGQFEAGGRAFTVTDAGAPMPWCNVVCNGRMGFVVSHNGGGFTWLDDAQHNVLTRWEMDLVRDCYGKFLYVADLDAGEVWSLAPAPCRVGYERYACTHAMGTTTFHTRYRSIDARWTMAVAPADNVELWAVELTNSGSTPRRLRISSYFEWTCGVAPDVKREFHRLFFKTDHHARRRAIFATKVMWDIRPKSEREHWNQAWPYHAAHWVGGAKLDREMAVGDKGAFLGRYGSTHAPAAMRGPAPAPGGFGRFGDAAAALGGEILLAPGQTVKLHYGIGIAPTRAGVEALVDRYAEGATAAAAIAAAGDAWSRRLAPTSVQTQREDFDLLNNHWLPYQAISGRLWGRTGYYQQSGAFGFRDQLQDSQVWLPLEARRCLDQILLHAGRQFADGSVYHWWHALADFGNHTACSDDYLWLPFVVAAYLRETGDFGALRRTAPLVNDPREVPLIEHCRMAMARAFARTSPRGLPHIGSCDWNDGLSAMGIEERGESVWLGMFLCEILDDWAVILERIGDTAQADDYRQRREAYARAINEHAWEDGTGEKVQSSKPKVPTGNGATENGEGCGGAGHATAGPQATGAHGWYRYGTKDSGEWVGAADSPAGKVHLNAQTWAVLADIAPPERATAAWATVKARLLSPYGPLLLWPAYTEPDPTIGYITRYSPGSRENGGVYMHAATWALAAACKMRDAEAVSAIWASISPPVRGQDAEGYVAEPYVTPGNVDGPLSDKPGRAGWTWYTGSAAWLNRVSLEWVLGIRPVFLGRETALRIDPCPPRELGKVCVTRTWRGVAVRVRFDAAEFARAVAESGVAGEAATTVQPRLAVNGRTIEGLHLTEALLAGAGSGGGGGAAGHQVVDVEVTWTRVSVPGDGGVGDTSGGPATPVRSSSHGRAES